MVKCTGECHPIRGDRQAGNMLSFRQLRDGAALLHRASMEEETSSKRRWKRWLIGGLAALVILPLLAWQVVESEWFLRA